MDYIDFSKIYSYSKIKIFDDCPRQYHFSYIDPIYSKMRSKLNKDPENIWAFNTLGRAIHDAITLFLHQPKDEKTQENLKKQLRKSWRSEALWQKLPPLGKWGGFETLEQEREFYRQALKMLSNFYKMFPKNNKIKHLPTSDLKNSIEDYKKLVQPIGVDFDISGKIDLVLYQDNDGLEVVDFKTGKDIGDNNFQLQFYKLLASLNFKLPIKKASFYYLKDGVIRDFDLIQLKNDEIQSNILKKINKILKEKEFDPKPSKLCDYCIYKKFCPAIKKMPKGPLFEEEDVADDLPF